MTAVEWVRANRASPCPVCSTHYCSVSADDGLVVCTKERSDRSQHAIESMVALTKTITGPIALQAAQLDANPMLLGVENSVVDLRPGEGHEARREAGGDLP
jgi:hypothetical protein